MKIGGTRAAKLGSDYGHVRKLNAWCHAAEHDAAAAHIASAD